MKTENCIWVSNRPHRTFAKTRGTNIERLMVHVNFLNQTLGSFDSQLCHDCPEIMFVHTCMALSLADSR